MFYKDLGRNLLKKSFQGSRIKIGLENSKILKCNLPDQENLRLRSLFMSMQHNFSTAVDLIKNKNPQVNSTSEASLIYWEKVRTVKAINGVMIKYKIPKKIENNKSLYPLQLQLYIALVNLKEEELNNDIFEIFLSLHNSAMDKIANLKSVSQYKNDYLFNNFCIALFKGQNIMKKRNLPILFRVQTDLTFMKALLQDKFPVSSFMSEVVPCLSLEELKECCNILLQAGFGDFVMRVINTPSQYLKEEFKNELQVEFFTFIHPHKLTSLSFLQQYFDYNLQIILKDKSKLEKQEIEKAEQRCLETIDVFLKYIKTQKNLNLQMSKIKVFFSMIQLSKLKIKKDQILQLDQMLTKSLQQNQGHQHMIFEIIDNLQLLSYEEGEQDEVQKFLIDKKNGAVNQIANNQLVGENEVSQGFVDGLTQQLKGIDSQQLKEHTAFKNLNEFLQAQVKITNIIYILFSTYWQNKEAAKMLITKDIQTLINESVIFLPRNHFSHLISLNNKLLSVPMDLMLQYIAKNYQNFSLILLIQSFYMINSANLKNNYDAEEMIQKIIVEVDKQKEKLGFEELNLLLKSLQFMRNERQIFFLQEIIEVEANKRMGEESRYANLFFNLFQHRLLKQGLQAKYAINQIKRLIELLQSNNLVLSELDLFNFALTVQASHKYTNYANSDVINNFFMERVRINTDSPRFDQLAYIYISIILCSFTDKNPQNTKEILQYEKWILQNLEQKNKNQLIKFNQIAKVMHELTKIYHLLDQGRKNFFEEIYDKMNTLYKMEDDLGLSIWIFWQQSLVCNDINKFRELLNRIRDTLYQVASYDVKSEKQSVKFKQYNQNMKNQVQEIQVIQLYQSLQYYECNPNLFNKNTQVHQEILEIKKIMDNNNTIKNFQRAQSVKHESNAESNVVYVMRQALKQLNLNYEIQKEKQIENILFVDFYIEELNLAVECHGQQHFISDTLYLSEQVRNNYLKIKGYQIEIIPTITFIKLNQEEQLKLVTDIIKKHMK